MVSVTLYIHCNSTPVRLESSLAVLFKPAGGYDGHKMPILGGSIWQWWATLPFQIFHYCCPSIASQSPNLNLVLTFLGNVKSSISAATLFCGDGGSLFHYLTNRP